MVIAALSMFAVTNAQSVEENLKFGLKVQANFANLTGSDISGNEGRFAFGGGVYMNYALSEKIKIQPEILYSLQGAQFTNKSTSGGTTTETIDKVGLSYINTPIMFKYYVTKSLNLELGPQFGFLIGGNYNQKVITTTGSTSTTVETDTDIKSFFKGFDFGIGAGVGYEFDSGLNLGARYNIGTNDIVKDTYRNGNGDKIQMKNSVFQLSVGYSF